MEEKIIKEKIFNLKLNEIDDLYPKFKYEIIKE